MNNKQQHEEMLYPCVRVRTATAGGSGTIIYSQPDLEGKYRTYVLTCEHVVDGLISIEKKWDSVLKMDRRMEVLGKASVELFYYEHLSRCKGSSGQHRANIVAYDKDGDIALLELEKYESGIEYVSNMYPKDSVTDIHVLDELFCSGAAMGHEPIITKGNLCFMDQIIDAKEYWMSTAQSIFGNSGGSVFRRDETREQYEFIGMPARITIAMYGFTADAITHMGFFVPITRIYDFLKRNHYEFIFDPDKTYEQCKAERESHQDKERRLLEVKLGDVAST